MTFSPEQDQYLQLAQTRAYYEGLREGVRMYAYWKEGVQYVGTTGKSLREAIATIDLDESNTFKKYTISSV